MLHIVTDSGAVIAFAAFHTLPVIIGVFFSFTNYVGLQNFRKLGSDPILLPVATERMRARWIESRAGSLQSSGAFAVAHWNVPSHFDHTSTCS